MANGTVRLLLRANKQAGMVMARTSICFMAGEDRLVDFKR